MSATDREMLPTPNGPVPIPGPIAALPRARGGLPVPWVTEWENPGLLTGAGGASTGGAGPSGAGAGEAGPGVGWAADAGYVVRCACVIGAGRPMFGHLCPVRQRTAMRRRICQICGKRISGSEPVLFLGGHPPGGVLLYTEPPLHAACAAFSLHACPKLRHHRDGQVAVTTATSYELLERRRHPRPPTGSTVRLWPVGHPLAATGVLDFLVAVPVDATVQPAAEWLAEHDLRPTLPTRPTLPSRPLDDPSASGEC